MILQIQAQAHDNMFSMAFVERPQHKWFGTWTGLSKLEEPQRSSKLKAQRLKAAIEIIRLDEAPRSKLRGILRNSQTRRPEPLGGVPKPLPSFAKASEGSPRLAYSAEAATSAAKAGHPRSKLRGIRRRRINRRPGICWRNKRNSW